MPGILKMDSSSREAESKKRNHEGKMVNGDRTPVARRDLPGGAPTTHGPADAARGANGSLTQAPTTLPESVANQIIEALPPDIVHIASDQYHALSQLIQRICQECFNDLNETLTRMNDLNISQPNGHLTNGSYAIPNGPDNSESNKQRKLLLMKFAYDSRAKFIKLLVLTEWGKKASVDVSKLVDLFTWTREQSDHMNMVDGTLDRLRFEAKLAQQNNPDIRTALEVLGTKKAEWIPDMGFKPPEPMSAERALKLLRYMNTSLSIRLMVHEKLPRQFNNWRIANGRVTFTVEGEFELDVMSLVEDASDPWIFVDFRLLFSTAPSIALDSAFMNRLRMGVDEILRTDGLEQCFKYLHNFTLTHKISVLASQASELFRNDWAGAFRIELAHRVLVIQYWPDKPGKKNWIEIGIASNRPKDGKVSWRGPPIPSLAVRWFRQGVQVTDVKFNFDWSTLSAERIMKHVIALHVAHLLQATHKSLNPSLVCRQSISETEPSDCKLDASLGSSANKITLSIEPVTGRFAIRPVNMLSSTAENAVNRAADASSVGATMSQLLARSLLDSITQVAQQLSWRSGPRQSLKMETVKSAVSPDILRFAIFWPRGWTPTWALAAIVEPSGESWWICNIGSNGTTIDHAVRLTIQKQSGCPLAITRATLTSIERVAVHTLSYFVTTRELARRGKAFRMGNEFGRPRHISTVALQVVQGWALHLKTLDLLKPRAGENPWLHEDMHITCQGFCTNHRDVWHVAKGTMTPDAAADMKKLMSASPQNRFIFHEGGKFAILLYTPFGTHIVDELKMRLRDLDRLRSFARTLQKRKMLLVSSSLEQVHFQYSKSFWATVEFGDNDDIHVKFGRSDPNNRIRVFLADIINGRSRTGDPPGDGTAFDKFCSALMLTRPALSALDEIETPNGKDVNNPVVYYHAAGIYRIHYNNPACSFDVRLRSKEDLCFWSIEDNEKIASDFRPRNERSPDFRHSDRLRVALQKLFKSTGQEWQGVRTGIVAGPNGINDALKSLHQAVISCRVDGVNIKQEKPSSSGAPATNAAMKQPNMVGKPGPTNTKQPPPGRPNGMGAKPPPKGNNREVITID